jgi:tRNA threonylcarbamoyladenosine biosynthesis protein TsaB
MATIVNIETATKVCSVSLSIQGKCVSFRESMAENSHSGQITVFVDEVIRETGISINNVDAFSVSKGPGSYTGLRIGISTVKGFCYALEKPLIAVGTLESMAAGFINTHKTPEKILYCPMIDARRMEVYCALFNIDLKNIFPISAKIIDEKTFSEFLTNNQIAFFGDGAEKCKTVLLSENALFFKDFNPSSRFMIEISEKKFHNGDFEDVINFEPYYLKDFIAGAPTVKGLY